MTDKFLDFIWDKESSKGTHPKKMATGGDYQIKKIMFDDVNRLSAEAQSKKWTYDEVINDPVKGRYYAQKSFDVVLPHYISSWNLPNTVDTKIAMWNWGPAAVRKAKGDLTNAPTITKKYISDYQNAFVKITEEPK